MQKFSVWLLNCKRKPVHLVWNVVVTEVFYAFCIPVHREESILKKDKRITMVKFENGLRNNSFISGIKWLPF